MELYPNRIIALTWNLRRARHDSQAWEVIRNIDPDIALLQEVSSIPGDLLERYSSLMEKATSKNGKPQTFGSAILVKGKILNRIQFNSEFTWVNKEIEFFSGNLLSCEVEIKNVPNLKVTSVYSPAWPVDKARLQNIDTTPIKLEQDPDLWCTELLWAGLKNEPNLRNENWIVAGDFNSSVSFDYTWGSGNQEIIDRMNAIGLMECLESYNGELTPTFRNPKGGKVIHQIDHMYTTVSLHSTMVRSYVGDADFIFGESLSDHLPIITEFDSV